MLNHLALRTAALFAIKGQTSAGDLVFDTGGLVPPSDEDKPRFSVVIETDGSVGSRCVLALTLSVLIRDIHQAGDDQLFETWATPITSAAAERALDVLESEVIAALRRQDGEWGPVFRSMIGNPVAWPQLRHGPSDPSIAQRSLCIDVDIEPKPTEQFLSQLDDTSVDPDLAAAFAGRISGLGCGLTKAESDRVLREVSQSQVRAAA